MAAVAAASNTANPFSIPTDGYTFTVGEATTLKWEPTTDGTISLILQWGAVLTGDSGTVIASDIDNDGSYTWDVPSTLAAEPDYTIKIVSDEDSDDYNYLGRFTVEGATVSVTTTTATSTTASSTSTKSSTSTTATSTESTSSSSATTASATTATTLTTASSTAASTSATETSESSSTASSTSTSASSSASQSAVPTTNAGLVNRVSGGMLALVAGAMML
ncbi:unnamed protein product [Penicillium glandicola]